MILTLENVLGVFPAGTTVGAYEQALEDAGHPVPLGEPIDMAVVSPEGEVTFAGLVGAGVTYYIAAKFGDDWRILRATTSAPSSLTVVDVYEQLQATVSDVELLDDNLSIHEALTTDAHGGIVADDDERLSDARAPLAHGASHESGGDDPLSFLAFRGEWDAEESYFTNDVVKHNGETYLNIKADAAGHVPSVSPTYWLWIGGLSYVAEDAANKGIANGYASLEAAGKVPVTQLPSALMEYQGAWNASTNTPNLEDGKGGAGDVYRVTAAAARDLGSGAIDFQVGDYAIYNGAIWEKSDTTDSVASVAGKKGAVTLAQADVEGLVTALEGKQPLDSDLTAIAALATDAFGRELLTKSTAASIRAQIEAQYTVGGFFDVKNPTYGAKGDNATSDSTAINAAITAAEAAGGGVVYFPSGTYIIDATLTLKPKVHLCGAGVAATVLKLKNGAKTDVIKTANYGAGGIADFSVRELTIDGNLANNTTGNGLLIDGLRFQLDSLRIHHAAEDNLNVQSTGTGADEDAVGGYESVACHLKLYLAGGRNLRWDAQDGRLHDVIGIAKDAESKKTNILIGENAGICKLTNCHAWGQSKYGWVIQGSSVLVGCEAEGAVTANVLLEADGVAWIGGKVFKDGSGHGEVGFEWASGKGHNVSISGVRVKECQGGSFKFTGNGEGSRVTALVELPEGKSAVTGEPDASIVFDISVRGGGTAGVAQRIKRRVPGTEETILDLGKDGDAKARFLLESNGLLAWGGGALSTDVFLYRTEAKTVRLEGRLDRTERQQELASAATITPSAWADVLLITGTTEIKKITATRAGHVLILRWASTAKLVAGENLKI
ncbi:MAG: glycosyl hydrolase family 28-related protein, partial [Mycobacterium sp.]|nr:glycosyl hydrolase family 28-related protein [Mycobacterium sp.]